MSATQSGTDLAPVVRSLHGCTIMINGVEFEWESDWLPASLADLNVVPRRDYQWAILLDFDVKIVDRASRELKLDMFNSIYSVVLASSDASAQVALTEQAIHYPRRQDRAAEAIVVGDEYTRDECMRRLFDRMALSTGASPDSVHARLREFCAFEES